MEDKRQSDVRTTGGGHGQGVGASGQVDTGQGLNRKMERKGEGRKGMEGRKTNGRNGDR